MSEATITTEEMGLLREEANLWMPDWCDIYRVTTGDDDYGGSTEEETVLTEMLPCSIESGAAQEQVTLLVGQQVGTQIFTVTLPADTDIRVTDHLVIRSQNDLHLRIQAVMDPESWDVEVRVIGSEEGEHLG